MSITISKEFTDALTAALIDAKKMAATVDTEDGGTCNFDAAAIRIPGMTEEVMEPLTEAAGFTTFTPGGPYWKNWWLVNLPGSGQGNHRTRVAEAVSKRLAELGYETSVYYQID